MLKNGSRKLIEMGERMDLKGTLCNKLLSVKKELKGEKKRRSSYKWCGRKKMMLQLETAEKGAEIKKEADKRHVNILKAEAELNGKEKAEADKSTGVKALRPKLPKFDEGKDDMDAFLERFERLASSQGWPEEIWAVSLSPLLTGKGLQVYSSMPSNQANDYEELKKAILKRYQLTEEGFRLKFREGIPEKGETVFQFMARMRKFSKGGLRWLRQAILSNL